jgi:hypothetical protein
MTKNEIFEELKKRGAAKAIVTFSGGGDEGGVNCIDLFDASSKNIGSLDENFEAEKWNPETKRMEPVENIPMDGKLANALGKPVYDKYGGFAGEFYVSGEIIYDVAASSIKINGTEEVSHGESFEEEL